MRQNDKPVNTKVSFRTKNEQGLKKKLTQSFSSIVLKKKNKRSTMKTNEQGEVWLDKVQSYVCPSYLNETCTDFREQSSELVYNIYQKY